MTQFPIYTPTDPASMGAAVEALPSVGTIITQMRAMLSPSIELVKSATIQCGLRVFKK